MNGKLWFLQSISRSGVDVLAAPGFPPEWVRRRLEMSQIRHRVGVSNVQPTDPVRVERIAYNPGLLEPWHVAVRLPDIVEPPGAAVP